jgi:hypothetical protein
MMNPDSTASPMPVDPTTGLPFSYGTPLDGLPPSAAGLQTNPGGFGMLPPQLYGMMAPPQPGLPGLMDPTIMSYGGLGYSAPGMMGFPGGSLGYGMPPMLPSASY